MKVSTELGGHRKQQSSNRLYVDAIFGLLTVVSNFTIHIIVPLILGRARVVRGNPW
jgi:hypothetical protein